MLVPFRGADQHVPRGRHDRAHRLRDDDPPQGTAPAQPERLRGLRLPGVHGQDAAAHHLGRVRGLVQGQADDGGERGTEQVDRLHGDELRAEGDAEAERRVERADVEPEQQLHQQRRGPEDPHIAPAQRAQHRVRRQTHHGEHGPEHKAQHHDHGGQPQGQQQPVEHGGRGEVPACHAPLEGVVADDGVHHHREQQQSEGGGQPPAGVPARHDPGFGARWRAGRAGTLGDGLGRDVGRGDHGRDLRGEGTRAWVTPRHARGAGVVRCRHARRVPQRGRRGCRTAHSRSAVDRRCL